MGLSRRRFLQGALGTGLVAPLLAACRTFRGAAAVEHPASPFRHGVASGDPLSDRVILWTRVSSARDEPVELAWTVANDPGLRSIVSRGSVLATARRDYTAKVDAGGLEPGRTYYYQFRALGRASPVGRTRTLSQVAVERARIAVVSCANLPFGYFNVYGLVAQRADLDLVLHLGDYIYEFANGTYGDGTALGRVPEPDREAVSLADYRTRHAQYKTDPDLQELHRQHPVIAVWDDHEIANDAWRDGAQGHNPELGEGEWPARKAAAMRAYLEWLPIREIRAERRTRIYRSFRIGDLADLMMLDARLYDRDQQAAPGDLDAINDPSRSLLGATQERWLFDELRDSARAGTPWRLIGQQVMFGQRREPDGSIRWTDGWDGYAASRARVFDTLRSQAIGNVAILSGDAHSSWAMELAPDPFSRDSYDPVTGAGSLAVEFVTPAISSAGIAEPEEAGARAAQIRASHRHVKFVNLVERGYFLLDVDRERAQAEWYFAQTVLERSRVERFARAFQVRSGESRLVEVSTPAPVRDAAPLAPEPGWTIR